MLVIVIQPGKKPELRELSGGLEEMQSTVGGLIQALYPFPDEVALICNDEGKLMGLPANRGLWDENGNVYDIICGTFLVVGTPSDSDEFASLTPEQVRKFNRRFYSPEMFVRINGQIICVPVEDGNTETRSTL